ncbi:Sec23/Sec24 trunk domain-containing protein, partial [Blyttiomyces helicus]
PIDVVDLGEAGPIRCNRCKAYINPFFIFFDGGRKFKCNLCAFDNEVPSNYFVNLDMNGRRIDADSRPELKKGTVEFVASKEYSNRPAKPASYIFAIDVTWNSLQSGMLARCVQAIKELLYSGEKGLPVGARVGIMTYDKSVHFYNLKSTLEQPQMLVVADVEETFVPLSAGLLVDPYESKVVIENLLDSLPTIFEATRISESVLGASALAAYSALKDHGGKLIIFQTSLPTVGPGALKNREDIKLLGTDKERNLYEPQEYFWKKLGQDCCTAGISVDLFLFPNAYIDIATIGALSSLTGGETFNYTSFDGQRDGLKFSEDLKTLLRRTFGYEALLRIRVSNGLKVSDYFGNFYMKNATDIELAGLDSLKSIGVALHHDGKLDEKMESGIQAALLYTTASGARRIRVHNISFSNTSLLGDVFRLADMDTTVNYLAKAGKCLNLAWDDG